MIFYWVIICFSSVQAKNTGVKGTASDSRRLQKRYILWLVLGHKTSAKMAAGARQLCLGRLWLLPPPQGPQCTTIDHQPASSPRHAAAVVSHDLDCQTRTTSRAELHPGWELALRQQYSSH